MTHWYLHSTTGGAVAVQTAVERLRRGLDRPDIWLTTNIDGQLEHHAGGSGETKPTLEQVDAIVVEGTNADSDVGFLLAHAMAMKKPTLYLYARGTVPKIFQHLPLNSLPNWIHIVSYQPKSIDRHLEEFLLVATGHRIKAAPRIKFTLRITSLIDEYLRYRTANSNVSKADWVRDLIEKAMEHDEDWQALRRRPRAED